MVGLPLIEAARADAKPPVRYNNAYLTDGARLLIDLVAPSASCTGLIRRDRVFYAL